MFKRNKPVGVIGLGIIGTRVAACLRKADFPVYVWSRSPKPEPNFLGSPAEVAETCDAIQVFVSNHEALLECVNAMAPSLKKRHVILNHTTVAPEHTVQACEIVTATGAQFLDAPFTGTREGAGAGTLTYVVSGEERAFKKAQPVLEASCDTIVRLSKIGHASALKVATNLMNAMNLLALAECYALIRKIGIDSEEFSLVVSQSASQSRQTDTKLPQMIEGDFDPHFYLEHLQKDVNYAMEMAKKAGLTYPLSKVTVSAIADAMSRGQGRSDYSILIRNYLSEADNPPLVKEKPSEPAEKQEPAKEEPKTPAAAAGDPEKATPKTAKDTARIAVADLAAGDAATKPQTDKPATATPKPGRTAKAGDKDQPKAAKDGK